MAEELRKAWDLGSDPIENLVETLEDKYIRVVLIEADPEFDASLVWGNGNIPVIVANKALPGDRQRLSICHELGHLILESGPEVDLERAAMRFAGAFLVPANVVRRELGEKRRNISVHELHLLKHKYGLSMQAWLFRAKELGILSFADAQRIFKGFRARGWHKEEPGEQVPSESSTRFERMVWRALGEGILSMARAGELLDLPPVQLGEELATRDDRWWQSLYNRQQYMD